MTFVGLLLLAAGIFGVIVEVVDDREIGIASVALAAIGAILFVSSLGE